MLSFYQRFFVAGWVWVSSVLLPSSLWAQPQENASQPQRIAVLDISHDEISRAQSHAVARALSKICREDPALDVASESSLAAYLKKHPSFSISMADSVQTLCQYLKLDYLIVSMLESPAGLAEKSGDSFANVWRITLRWLDGSTGQITKIHTRECAGDINLPESFPLRDLLHGLLASPEIILAVDNAPTEMPPLEILSPVSTPVADSATVINPPVYQTRRGRHWLWYVTGAVLISGGSAALLIKKQERAPMAKPILPEPPEPPRQ